MMTNVYCRLFALLLMWGASASFLPSACGEENAGLVLPEGFRAKLFADDDLAHDVFCMTLDYKGRVVVSGPGYIRILVDTDGDGTADESRLFAESPRQGAQGMCAFGADLLVIGDGGLWRYRDRNGDDKADGPPEKFMTFRTGGEHDTHAIRKGPDGYWYVLAGNNAGISESYINSPGSPIRSPSAGCLLRFAPNLREGEVIAHGFRNAYDFDFGENGDVFVYDSDGERDISMPWYRPTRVYSAIPGSHAGWISQSWKQPNRFTDQMPAVAQFGRGSPTGVCSYLHTAFPVKYRGGVFVLDWTFGRILFTGLEQDGAGYTVEPMTFATAEGQFGFAPTDIEVAPDGTLYVSVGGRGTRGGVYRISPEQEAISQVPVGDASDDERLTQCLTVPQPYSAWARRIWEPSALKLGADAFLSAATDTKRRYEQRTRAIVVLTTLFKGLPSETLMVLLRDDNPFVRERAIWSHGRTRRTSPDLSAFRLALRDKDAAVRRIAIEALNGMPPQLLDSSLHNSIAEALGSEENWLRQSAIATVSRFPEPFVQGIGKACQTVNARAIICFAIARVKPPQGAFIDQYALAVGRSALTRDFPEGVQVDALRLLQIAVGDLGGTGSWRPVFSGYASRVDLRSYERILDPLRSLLADRFPGSTGAVQLEMARLIAMLEVSRNDVLAEMVKLIDPERNPIRATHFLIASARVQCDRTLSDRAAIANAFATLESTLIQKDMNRDRNYRDHLKAIYEAHRKLDPGLPAAIIAHAAFGEPHHIMFLAGANGDVQREGIAKVAARVKSDKDYPWNSDVVFIVGEVAENHDLLRSKFDDLGLRAPILSVLSESPKESDRTLFVEGLKSRQRDVLAPAVKGLSRLQADTDPKVWMLTLDATRRMQKDGPKPETQAIAIQTLDRWFGARTGIRPAPGVERDPDFLLDRWAGWIETNHPEAAAVVVGDQATEWEAVQKLMADADWTSGEITRGKLLFEKRACAKCHNGAAALGPSLVGISRRFSRDDLFKSIVAPDIDVSNRYRSLMVLTTDGEVHTGLVVYDSVDGVTIRTAEQKTIRIEADEIEERRKISTSIMPGGLLKDATSQDLADLYRYLQTLN